MRVTLLCFLSFYKFGLNEFKDLILLSNLFS